MWSKMKQNITINKICIVNLIDITINLTIILSNQMFFEKNTIFVILIVIHKLR